MKTYTVSEQSLRSLGLCIICGSLAHRVYRGRKWIQMDECSACFKDAHKAVEWDDFFSPKKGSTLGYQKELGYGLGESGAEQNTDGDDP